MHVRSLKRIMNGGKAYIANIHAIATALGVGFDDLLYRDQPPPATVPAQTTEFNLTLTIAGELRSPEQLAHLVTMTPSLVESLAKLGITITVHQSQLSVVDRAGYDIHRIIMMVYGPLDTGGSYWCYVAVKPSRYREFLTHQRQGTLNLYKFEPYGDIIVSGEGATPPDEITRKVAEILHIDYDTFFKPFDLDKYLPPEKP